MGRAHETTGRLAGETGLLGSYVSSWSPGSAPTTQRLETSNVSYTSAYWIQMKKLNFICPGPEESIPNTAYS